MTTKEIKNLYSERIFLFNSKLNDLKRKKRFTSYLRLADFACILFIIYLFSEIGVLISSGLLLFLSALFLYLVKRNIKIKQNLRKTSILVTINENEVQALNCETNQFHSGNEYINYDHPFSYDLDIFGEGSLFQYLNRTCTISGKNSFAGDLSEIQSDKLIVEKKQEGIKELGRDIDFRHEFISTALLFDKNFQESIHKKTDDVRTGLKEWSHSKLGFIRTKFWHVLLIFLPAVSFSLLLFGIFNLLPYAFMWLSVLLNLSIIGFFLKRTNSEHQKLGKRTQTLLKVKELIKLIEFSNFQSQHLRFLQSQLTQQGSAYMLIQKLYKTLNAFDLRLNMIAGVLLNGFLMWDLQILLRLEKQKEEIKNYMDSIFDAIGSFDSLISFSNYHYNNPTYCFPDISEGDFVLDINAGGHPLIQGDQRISNDFKINGLHKIIIVTGANMAGKSTFLRTVGVNMILASSGAPVCADKMRLTLIPIYTSVRTNDSLHKNESYFFAELMRLKKITDILKSGERLFVIIDEMLKGTNSKDKHIGSYELIKQLIQLNTSGLAATHDIQLGKMADEFPNNVSNKRFEVEIKDNELVFDYKLKDGISQNLNASFLMKKYGIIE